MDKDGRCAQRRQCRAPPRPQTSNSGCSGGEASGRECNNNSGLYQTKPRAGVCAAVDNSRAQTTPTAAATVTMGVDGVPHGPADVYRRPREEGGLWGDVWLRWWGHSWWCSSWVQKVAGSGGLLGLCSVQHGLDWAASDTTHATSCVANGAGTAMSCPSAATTANRYDHTRHASMDGSVRASSSVDGCGREGTTHRGALGQPTAAASAPYHAAEGKAQPTCAHRGARTAADRGARPRLTRVMAWLRAVAFMRASIVA